MVKLNKKFFSEPIIIFFSWICDISSKHGAVSILNELKTGLKVYCIINSNIYVIY